MRCVILESPYAGDIAANVELAKAAIGDCLRRGEAPIASHLLFTQAGILNDADPEQRRQGIAAGLAWYPSAAAIVFYLDHGWSKGMREALAHAQRTIAKPVIEYRFRYFEAADYYRNHPSSMASGFYAHWTGIDGKAPADAKRADMPTGRLEVHRHRRPPTPAAPFEATIRGQQVAFYATMNEAQRGLELLYQCDRAGPDWEPPALIMARQDAAVMLEHK